MILEQVKLYFSLHLKSDNIINNVNAHNDAVTSLCSFNDIYLFSTSHDTKVKMWDVRNLTTCVQEKIVILFMFK